MMDCNACNTYVSLAQLYKSKDGDEVVDNLHRDEGRLRMHDTAQSSSTSRCLPLPYTSNGNPVTYNSSRYWFYVVKKFVLC